VLDQTRLLSSDLSLRPFDPVAHEVAWTCSVPTTTDEVLQYCPESTTNEQYFQLSFFDRPGAGSRAAVRKPKPQSPSCVQLPPPGYVFPKKMQSMPLAEGEQAVNWPNLRVNKLEDLLVFNRGTPKNLYHFNASFYDYEQEAILDAAAKVIPFGHKVRTMLDVGSGGGSLGMLAKRRYDVQVVSTVFADWPYCEYISERGQICMYIDAMEAMPFAKFSYDVVHSSWVFHALFTHQLRAAFLEQNRVLRPGGYLWIYGVCSRTRQQDSCDGPAGLPYPPHPCVPFACCFLSGGWSNEQVETIDHLLVGQLGYTYLENTKTWIDTTKVKHAFDSVPYQLDWNAILVKPIRADEKTCQRVYQQQ
jgi:SAM-dependent methyltransferase